MTYQETYSVSEIQRLCDQTEYLDGSEIRMCDKGVSFDGHIVYYKNKKPTATGNEITIPVQIKGQACSKLPAKHSITYPVRTRDLDNYFNNGGALYFVVKVEKITYRCKPYARILLPVDIQRIRMGNEKQNDLSVTLHELVDANALLQLCVLFSENRVKQGVLVAGVQADMTKCHRLTFSGLRGKYANPAVIVAKSPITYLYSNVDGIDIPIVASEVFTSTESSYHIEMGSDSFRFPVKHIYSTTKTDTIIAESIKVSIDEENKKINISLLDWSNVDFDKVANIARFLLKFKSSTSIKINGLLVFEDISSLNKAQERISDRFISFLERLVSYADILSRISLPLSAFTIKDVCESHNAMMSLKDALVDHAAVYLRNEDGTMPHGEIGIYYQAIGQRVIVVEYEKADGDKYFLRDYLRNPETKVGIFCNVGGSYRPISKWFAVLPEQVHKVVFNRNKMVADLTTTSDEFNAAFMTDFALYLLNSYDESKNANDLLFAEDLLRINIMNEPEAEINIINTAQVSYRRGALSQDTKNELARIKMNSEDRTVRCCICILLQQKEEFEVCFNQLSSGQQEAFRKWPIYNLLR